VHTMATMLLQGSAIRKWALAHYAQPAFKLPRGTKSLPQRDTSFRDANNDAQER
jgi:hypothetical protein